VDIDNFKPFNEMNGHDIGKNADGLEQLISLVLSTIEENFELTPKCAGSERIYRRTP
jgi:GGDEF domain-containing protein